MTDDTKPAEVNWTELRPQIIKIALELGPLAVFYLVTFSGEGLLSSFPVLRTWFSTPLILATAPFMVAMSIALLISWFVFKRVAIMPLVTAVLVLAFGGLTLYFQDSLFIKIKPTIVNGLFAATLLGGMLFSGSLLKYVFGDVYHLKSEGWRILTIRWGLFFVILAIMNEAAWRGAIAFYADADAADKFYAAFKFWGTFPVVMVFSMLQLPLLNRYAEDPKAPVSVVPPMDPLP